MAVHELKTWPEPFQAVRVGGKTFEWRKHDRNFEWGDIVVLKEWDPGMQRYTGREVIANIGYVLSGPSPFGLPEGYCVFSLIDVQDRKPEGVLVERSPELHGEGDHGP